MRLETRHILETTALSFLNVPYKWGGANPLIGFDCSGLVQEILASVGADPVGDQTSQALYDHFIKRGQLNTKAFGALAFYGRGLTSIIHVAFHLDDRHVIEAAGGGSKTHSLDDAIKANAFVKIRPVAARKDYIVSILPEYP